MIPGLPHFPIDEDAKYSRIFGGVAWPAVRPGFIVIVGEHKQEHVAGLPQLVVLDEAVEARLWHVVEKAAALRMYYHPESIYTDTGHVAALQFIAERQGQGLWVEHSLLCAMEGPLGYALPVLKRLLDLGRLGVPKTSLLQGELMTAPVHEDLAKLRLSDYPALAALAFAVLGLESTRRDATDRRPDEVERPGRILG